MNEAEADAIAREAANLAHSMAAMKAGGWASVIGLLSQSWFLGAVGLVLSLIGFIVTMFLTTKRTERELEAHNILIAQEARAKLKYDAEMRFMASQEAREIEEHMAEMIKKRRPTDGEVT